MKKEDRIKKSDEIETVMKKGISCANRTFIIYKYQNSEIENYRVAISAPKKLGNAVTRNKIKRQMRAILQQNSSHLKAGHDYFIIARPNLLELDFATSTRQMIHALKLTLKGPQSGHQNKKRKQKSSS